RRFCVLASARNPIRRFATSGVRYDPTGSRKRSRTLVRLINEVYAGCRGGANPKRFTARLAILTQQMFLPVTAGLEDRISLSKSEVLIPPAPGGSASDNATFLPVGDPLRTRSE